MSKKSAHLNLCVKNSGAVSLNTLDYTIKAKKSFQKIPGQPPKHIYRVPNLKATSHLQKAVVKGDIQKVSKLLTRAVDLSRKLPNGHTPLSYSIKKSDFKMAEWLLEHAADPNIKNKYGNAPLHFAVDKNDTRMTELLLKNGADPNIPDKKGKAPLHLAVYNDDKSSAELLLKYDANPNIQDEKVETPLYLTLKRANNAGAGKGWNKVQKYYKIANLLLKKGADPNIPDKDGDMPLHRAVEKKDHAMAEYLVAHNADPNIPDKKGLTPLFYSVKASNLEMAKFLLANGADPNIPDTKGHRPLYWAVAISNSKEMTTLLLDNRAHPDIMKVDSEELSLYWAVHMNKNKEMTKLLVEKGANLNLYSKYYSQSYLLSKAVIEDNTDDVVFFVKHGSFVDIEILNANNSLDYALINDRKDMAAIILQNMSDKNISDPSKGTLLDPILDKIILHWSIHHKETEKINNIQLLSDLLEVFTVDNPNLNDKGVLFGSNTLPLLEELFNKILENQEEIHDVQAGPVQEMLKHNFKGFIYKFMQVVPVPELLEKYPSINELYISTRQLKSARKDIVPIEQSPEFLQQQQKGVIEIGDSNDQGGDELMDLSGQQYPMLENY